ncbi:hypothetical protein STEG23_002768 [Scotinomys teguina]
MARKAGQGEEEEESGARQREKRQPAMKKEDVGVTGPDRGSGLSFLELMDFKAIEPNSTTLDKKQVSVLLFYGDSNTMLTFPKPRKEALYRTTVAASEAMTFLLSHHASYRNQDEGRRCSKVGEVEGEKAEYIKYLCKGKQFRDKVIWYFGEEHQKSKKSVDKESWQATDEVSSAQAKRHKCTLRECGPGGDLKKE